MFDNVVYIGRFQPFHNGHLEALQKALEVSKHVTVVIGSSNAPSSPRNPFTAMERQMMITHSFPKDQVDRIRFVHQQDHTYNIDRWIAGIQTGVTSSEASFGFNPNPVKIGLIGHSKDSSSFYLDSFPQWERVDYTPSTTINATDIREDYFSLGKAAFEARNMHLIPDAVNDRLSRMRWDAGYDLMRREVAFVKDYKKQWAAAPYPPTFVTVDTIVVQSGHVLLVERGAMPGEGLQAIPGGFLNQGEFIADAAIRELVEETRLAVPAPVLKGSIVKKEVYDDPWRSQRGRTITHAFLIKLHSPGLSKVKGSDDARKAFWVPLSKLNRELMFEDHYSILENMIGL